MIRKSFSYSPKSGKFPNQSFLSLEAELKLLSDHTPPVAPSLTRIHSPPPPKKSHKQPSIDFPPPGKSMNIFIMHAPVITRVLVFPTTQREQ